MCCQIRVSAQGLDRFGGNVPWSIKIQTPIINHHFSATNIYIYNDMYVYIIYIYIHIIIIIYPYSSFGSVVFSKPILGANPILGRQNLHSPSVSGSPPKQSSVESSGTRDARHLGHRATGYSDKSNWKIISDWELPKIEQPKTNKQNASSEKPAAISNPFYYNIPPQKTPLDSLHTPLRFLACDDVE